MSLNNPIDLQCDTSNDDETVICFVFKQSTNTFSLGTIGSYINPVSIVFLSVDCVGMLSVSVYVYVRRGINGGRCWYSPSVWLSVGSYEKPKT